MGDWSNGSWNAVSIHRRNIIAFNPGFSLVLTPEVSQQLAWG
jgi:hypothetical protein